MSWAYDEGLQDGARQAEAELASLRSQLKEAREIITDAVGLGYVTISTAARARAFIISTGGGDE